MRTSAEKSTTSATPAQVTRQPFIMRAGAEGFFARSGSAAPVVQMKMTVNKPGDRFEQEADRTADRVMRMPTPSAGQDRLQRQPDDKVQRREEEQILRAAVPGDRAPGVLGEPVPPHRAEEKILGAVLPDDGVQKLPAEEQTLQRREAEILRSAQPVEQVQKADDDRVQKAPPAAADLQRDAAPAGGGGAVGGAVGGNVQSAIQNKTTGGEPLSADVRGHMEPRFNADFSRVRIHRDIESASLSNQLSARAFTYQSHIFFSRDQYQPGTSD